MTHASLTRAQAVAVGLGALALGFPRSASALETLRIATDPFDSYAEAYYARDRGFFKEANLEVELSTFASGAAIPPAVAGGSADVGISNPVVLANAISRGIPFTIIAGGGMYTSTAPTTLLCVAQKSSLSTPRDLNGKTIAVSTLNDVLYLAAKAWLKDGGGDPSSIRFIELPFSEMGPALASGRIDAAVLVEPALQGALERGQAKVIGRPYDAISHRFLIGAWFSTTSFVRSNPELIGRFVSAIYESARWANKNQSASAEILAKYAKMDPETTRRMTRVEYAQELNPGLIQPLLDLSYANGVLQQQMSAISMIGYRPPR